MTGSKRLHLNFLEYQQLQAIESEAFLRTKPTTAAFLWSQAKHQLCRLWEVIARAFGSNNA